MPCSNVRISNDFSAYPALFRQSRGLTEHGRRNFNTDIRLMSLVTRRKLRDRYHEVDIGNDVSSQTPKSCPTYLWFYIKDTADMCRTTCASDSP